MTEQPRTEAQAQSAPVQGADGAPGAQWRRLSPRMLLVHPVRELIRYIPVLAGAFFAGRNSDNGQWWSLIGVALVIGLSVVRWATTRFRITPDQVQLRTGLLRKRTIAAPADRVRSVDVTAHTLHRVLGLAKVSIGTGTYDRKKEGLVLDGLAAPQAAALRAELLHRGQSIRGPALRGPQPTNAVPDGRPINTVPDGQPINAVPEEQELVRQDPAWLRFAPFTLSGLITGLAILGFGWNALQQSHVDAGRLGPVQSASRHLSDTPLWLLVVQLLVGALVVISLLSVAGYLLSYYGFRLTRHTGGTLQVTRGLLTSRATSIEQTRLRGVELSEPLLLRAAGGARLIAVATGLRVGRGAERGGTVLVPPAPRSIVYEVGQRVLDEDGAWSAVADPLRRHGAAALRRRVVRACLPWLLITAALVLLTTTAGLPAWIPLSALALTLAFGWIGLDRYRSLGHLVVGSYLATGAGSLARRRVALEAEGIIGWNIRRTMFQRRLGLATLTATTAAGRQGYPVIDISSVDAVDVIRRATPGLLEEFIRQRQQDR